MDSIVQAVVAKEVAFAYPQEGNGFGPLSLSLQAGEGLLISGNSGSGKSTLARCLSGLIPHLYHGVFHGEVRLNGFKTDENPLWLLTEQTGLVFQNPAFQMLASTVEEEILFGLENLGLPSSETADRLEEALERFGLMKMRRRSPQTLSGGEQQKLALAAMLARCPPVLVLDEPLSMLDTTAACGLVARLGELICEGTAVVVCEHREDYLHELPGLRCISIKSPQPPEILPDLPNGDATDSVRDRTLVIEHMRVELGGRPILDDLNLALPVGQVTALVGPNGVGKTTFLRALAGFQSYEGCVEITGKEGKPAFGMVFQNPDLQLFNGSVREEILYRVPDPDMAWYGWLVTMLDLERYELTPPLLLSEGEKRRVALATVLMRQPGTGILLDEPALGQDARHKMILHRLLHALALRGYLVMYSTHDLELAARADQLILLSTEGILAQGPPRDVMRADAAWEKLGLVRPAWLKSP